MDNMFAASTNMRLQQWQPQGVKNGLGLIVNIRDFTLLLMPTILAPLSKPWRLQF